MINIQSIQLLGYEARS